MSKIALTDMGVQKLAQGTYFDTKTPAFGIRIGKHRKTWIATKGRDRKTITLGHYPALSLQKARRAALAAFVAPEVKAASITFPEALELFLAQDKWRPSSLRVLKSSLKHFSWTKPLAKISHEDVRESLASISSRSARAHALKDIRSFFNWCIPRYLSSSPSVGIKMEPQPSRDRVLTDDELKRVWIAAGELGQFGVIVKLLILTGQRRSEIGSLQPTWIQADRLVFPSNAVKNGREHILPIEPHSASLISTLNSLHSSPTWPAFSAWSKSTAKLLKLSGTGGWTLHDLRRTFATNLAALGVPIHVTEKILNHASGTVSGVAAIYNRHTYFSEMRDALQLWEERLLFIARQ